MRKNKHRGKSKKKYTPKTITQIVELVEAAIQVKANSAKDTATAFLNGQNKYNRPDPTPTEAYNRSKEYWEKDFGKNKSPVAAGD